MDNPIVMDLMLLCVGLGWLIVTIGPWLVLGVVVNLAYRGLISDIRGE